MVKMGVNKPERIAWVDYAKAILIFLVALGHTESNLKFGIYFFHIPAFYVISGYLSNYDNVNTGTFKSMKYLICAILLYNLIFIVYYGVFSLYYGEYSNSGVWNGLYQIIVRPLIGVVWLDNNHPIPKPYCGQFWFVWVLMIMKYMYRFISKTKGWIVCMILGVSLLYAIVIGHTGFRTFFYLDRSIVAFPFFSVGVLSAKYKWIDRFIPREKSLSACAMIVFVLIIYLCSFIYEDKVDLVHLWFGPSVILYYVFAFVLTILFITMIICLKNNCIVENISSGTFLLLGLQFYILGFLQLLPIVESTYIIVTTIFVLICYPLILFSNRYCPIMLGKKVIKKY